MNKRNKVVAVITSILLAASMASLSIPAQAEQNTDVAPMSCPEIGHHQSVSNKGRIFMAGSLPKNWLSPGGTYTVTKAKTTTVTGSVTGGVDAEFSSYVKAHVNRVYQPHRLSLKVRDGVGQTHQIPQNGFNLVQLDTNSITHGMTSFLRVMSSIKNISMQRCRQTSHGYITIDVSRKHRGNTREQIVPCPPFLEFFCGGKH